MDDLESAIFSNRDTVTATFATGEEIFGADIDHTGNVTIAIADAGATEQVGYDTYIRSMRLRLSQTATYTGTASLATLRLASLHSTQFTEVDVVRDWTFDQTHKSHDFGTDPGIFEGDFTQTHAEATAIRRYLLTTGRSSAVSLPDVGVDYPFGRSAGVGPFTVRIIEWSDLGRPNLTDWKFHIKMAREFT